MYNRFDGTNGNGYQPIKTSDKLPTPPNRGSGVIKPKEEINVKSILIKSKFIQIKCDDEVLYINIDTIKRIREDDEFKTEIITIDNKTFISNESIEDFIKRLGE